jgi:hypothetical protein
MRIQLGTVYMNSIYEFDNPIMGVVIRRMWWKPWRYSLTPIYWKVADEAYGAGPTNNLTKLEAIGTAKLLGVEHRDFKEN